ncbi:4'-phosphopantetheinyl transferase family protein [Streptomyces sp. G5(2025)]|uniref:4'-phosphopantetheinyl transferase family protein n=1 Tax=Streptomyces sp. G5(2025) TaxID=3406628 RepID=UPI003C14F40C
MDDAHEALKRLLDPVERARLAATHDRADRRRFLLGCAISRIALGEFLAVEPEEVGLLRHCPTCGGPHGKVRVRGEEASGIRLSVTHSGDLVGVAFCRSADVGLDVEPVDTAVDVAGLAPTVLGDSEIAALDSVPPHDRTRAFLRYWTRKEAVAKALGIGIFTTLRRLEMTAPDAPAAIAAWPERPDTASRVQVIDLRPPLGGDYCACLAVADASPVAVEQHRVGSRLRDWARLADRHPRPPGPPALAVGTVDTRPEQ